MFVKTVTMTDCEKTKRWVQFITISSSCHKLGRVSNPERLKLCLIQISATETKVL